MDVDLGSIPDWVTVIGALVALVFARAAARAAQKTNTQQAVQLEKLENAERRREELQRQQQASNLAFWVSLIREEGYRPVIRIMNGNPTPLYECTLYCATPRGITFITLNVVGPNTQPRIIQRFTERVRALFTDTDDFLHIMDHDAILVSGTFRDAQNQWWYRATDGSLSPGGDKAAVESLRRTDCARCEFPLFSYSARTVADT